MEDNKRKIRVLIVDDSMMFRKILNEILRQDSLFEVVAQAKNGEEAVKYVKIFKPDVISMDMIMPEMDGLQATSIIMQNFPTPIVIVSSIYKSDDIYLAIRELEAGAVAVTPKPEAPGHPDFESASAKYRQLLKIMSEIKVIKRKSVYSLSVENNHSTCSIPDKVKLIAIGASAGGPEALKIILQNLHHPVKVPIVVVQHIDFHFSVGYAEWLNEMCNSEIKVASNGEYISDGTIYIAPGNKHLEISETGVLKVTNPTENNGRWLGHVPSIDLLFNSVKKYAGSNSISILLSGMGTDGALGLKELKQGGSYTITQSRESSLIYGMPGAAEKLNASCRILSPTEIAEAINRIINNL